MQDDFRKYAVKHLGMSGSRLDSYMKITSQGGYISPTIIEERQLNVAQMDVFSRLFIHLRTIMIQWSLLKVVLFQSNQNKPAEFSLRYSQD